MAPFHPFKFYLTPIPVGLNTLSVCPGGAIHNSTEWLTVS